MTRHLCDDTILVNPVEIFVCQDRQFRLWYLMQVEVDVDDLP